MLWVSLMDDVGYLKHMGMPENGGGVTCDWVNFEVLPHLLLMTHP